jgi:hypothetical protein
VSPRSEEASKNRQIPNMPDTRTHNTTGRMGPAVAQLQRTLCVENTPHFNGTGKKIHRKKMESVRKGAKYVLAGFFH